METYGYFFRHESDGTELRIEGISEANKASFEAWVQREGYVLQERRVMEKKE